MGFSHLNTNDLLDLSDSYTHTMRNLTEQLEDITIRRDELDKEIIKRLQEAENDGTR